MTPLEFIKKWKPVALTERAAAQSHFNDLCALVGHDDPIKADPAGDWFTFEKGVPKTGGGDGFADVWKKGFFAWEYKKKKRNLDEAFAQLVRYAAALENPPLQVACDTDRILVRTAWTNAVPKTYELSLDDLADPQKLSILRSVFHEPDKLRPTETRAGLTREAADKFSTISLRLQGRGTPEEIAHFINQLVFCFFAHSVKLLPNGFFPRLLKRASESPENAKRYFDSLFAAMETGGDFDLTKIAHFNGGLFDGRRAVPLDSGDVGLLIAAASLDWSLIDPSIFGTLFERFLDPEKRGQIGAHYTDAEKIMMLVNPVIVRPLREEWSEAKKEIEQLVDDAHLKTGQAYRNAIAKAEEARSRFLERLRKVTVLDPACGSGPLPRLAGGQGHRASGQPRMRGAGSRPARTRDRAGNRQGHRDQSARGGACPHHDLDRRHPVEPAQWHLCAAGADLAQTGFDRVPGCGAGAQRRRLRDRGAMARSGVHCRQSAVSGRQADADRIG